MLYWLITGTEEKGKDQLSAGECKELLMAGGGFPDGSDGKNSACNAGDLGSISGLGRSTGAGNGYPLHYSCLENSTDRRVWQPTVHGVTKSWTRLSH